MSEKKEPIFVNGMFINEHVFSNGGSILKVGINVDLLNEFLQANKKQSGWCNLVISKKRNPSEKSTHYATLDTFEPGQRNTTAAPNIPPVQRSAAKPDGNYANPPTDKNADDVPF